MYEGEVQSVLRCRQCNKPFDKQSTLKRHGYYCRSRTVGSTTRSRSCISCARGKVRCDHRRPECSRCTIKAIECQYPNHKPRVTRPRTQHNDDATTEQRKMEHSLAVDPPSVENRQVGNDSDIILDSALVMSDPEFANIEEGYLEWDAPDIDFAEFLNPQTSDETVQYTSSGSSSFVRHRTSLTDQTIPVQQVVSSPNVPIPTIPTSNFRSLIQRPKMETGAQRVANLILHTLKSYPLMILRHNTLPPFIHPRLISSDFENNRMEPLTNCISLVHMISSGVRVSRKLFWKNVRLECERLCDERLKLNRWELLAAMQALSIYILIRMDEGETDYNNFDFLLLTTVTVIAKELTRSDTICNTYSTLYKYGLELGWEDWVFEESRRRLSVVYRVVNMLVYFEPATLCTLQSDLILAPLPSKKQLWEAGDEFLWKMESKRVVDDQRDYGLAANGELVKLDEGQLYCSDAVLLYKSLDARTSSRGTENWEEWCSGMDGFGGLIMLTASLIV